MEAHTCERNGLGMARMCGEQGGPEVVHNHTVMLLRTLLR
jgi:hypothetical protein